jgi:hypothetical protein
MGERGAGLLALLRRRSEPEPPQLGVVSASAGGGSGSGAASSSGSMFEARSSAVHALEHAVTAGTTTEAAKSAAQGRAIPPGPSYTFDVDAQGPGEAQPQLPVRRRRAHAVCFRCLDLLPCSAQGHSCAGRHGAAALRLHPAAPVSAASVVGHAPALLPVRRRWPP